ncbi:MAG: repressor LexA [Omnitrophica bacterium GWA2_52_8]|nr:MAG: repressor LexA [Omnitrophica bacterium GWA2_52_8]
MHFPQITAKLKNFCESRRRFPAFSEMQQLFGYRSKGGVARLMAHLIKRGVVRRDGRGRFVPAVALIPGLKLLGSIQAGFPSPAEEELVDTLSLDEYLIHKPEASYLVKVTGDSMIEAGICPGDLVIVERGRNPKFGDIVIAEVDGQWTMKYFEKAGSKTVLRPANKRYKEIIPKETLTIAGVVVATIRKYH